MPILGKRQRAVIIALVLIAGLPGAVSASDGPASRASDGNERSAKAARLLGEMESMIGRTLVLIEFSRAKKNAAEQSYLYAELKRMVAHVQAVRAIESELMASSAENADGTPEGLSEQSLSVVSAHAAAVKIAFERLSARRVDSAVADAGMSVVTSESAAPLVPQIDKPDSSQLQQPFIFNYPLSITRPPPTSPFQVGSE